MQYGEPATIISVERANNSKDGNPRYRVTLDDGTAMLTKADAALNHYIGNPEFRDGQVRVAITGKGAARSIVHVVTVWTPEDAAELKRLGKFMSTSKEMARWRVLCAKRDASKRLEE
jgi:hypothetical protein